MAERDPTALAAPSNQQEQAYGQHQPTSTSLPRISIKYCTQCRWMLRAAYLAQELLSTFSTTLGEVALVPATGGVFTVSILHHAQDANTNDQLRLHETVLWDRNRDGGFPETKQLKSLVRNIVDPGRDMGHVDRALLRTKRSQSQDQPQDLPSHDRGQGQGHAQEKVRGEECEDCK